MNDAVIDDNYKWPACTVCGRDLREAELGRQACRPCQRRVDDNLEALADPHGLYASLARALAPPGWQRRRPCLGRCSYRAAAAPPRTAQPVAPAASSSPLCRPGSSTGTSTSVGPTRGGKAAFSNNLTRS